MAHNSQPFGTSSHEETSRRFADVYDVVLHMTQFLDASERVNLRKVNRLWRDVADESRALADVHAEALQLVEEHNKAKLSSDRGKYTEIRVQNIAVVAFGIGTLLVLMVGVIVGNADTVNKATPTVVQLVIYSELCAVLLVGILTMKLGAGKCLQGLRMTVTTSLCVGFVAAGIWFLGSAYDLQRLHFAAVPTAECMQIWNRTYHLGISPSQMLFLRPDQWNVTGAAYFGRYDGDYFVFPEIRLLPNVTAESLKINCTAAILNAEVYAEYYHSVPFAELPSVPSVPLPGAGDRGAYPFDVPVAVINTRQWPHQRARGALLLQGIRSGAFSSTVATRGLGYGYNDVWYEHGIPGVAVEAINRPDPTLSWGLVIILFTLAGLCYLFLLLDVITVSASEYMELEKKLIAIPDSAESGWHRQPLTLSLYRELRRAKLENEVIDTNHKVDGADEDEEDDARGGEAVVDPSPAVARQDSIAESRSGFVELYTDCSVEEQFSPAVAVPSFPRLTSDYVEEEPAEAGEYRPPVAIATAKPTG